MVCSNLNINIYIRAYMHKCTKMVISHFLLIMMRTYMMSYLSSLSHFLIILLLVNILDIRFCKCLAVHPMQLPYNLKLH